jgi:hypothetical protein
MNPECVELEAAAHEQVLEGGRVVAGITLAAELNLYVHRLVTLGRMSSLHHN